MNGFEASPIGFGTYDHDDRAACIDAVTTALDVGYRHIDTAQSYGNEAYIGDAIERSSVAREDIFLATKVDTANLAYDDVIESTTRSLDRLGVEYLDLLYVHWPTDTYDPERTLAAFDELYDEGIVRNVGVSNFEPDQLDEARAILDAPIFANQVELHPLLPQERLRAYADRHDHHVVAYSPFAQGEIFGVPEVTDVAEKHGVSEAQVALAWHLAKGVTPIPKASGDHIRDNWQARDRSLDREDVRTLDSIERTERVIDPDAAPWN